LATLSTASNSEAINGGIVIWRNTESHAVTDFLSNRNNSKFLSLISLMKDLQLKDENNTKNIIKTLSTSPENHNNDYGNDASQQRINKDKEKGEMGHKSSSNKVWVGVSVTDLTPDLSEDRGLPINSKGIAIQSVFPDSPAYLSGIRGISLDVDQNGYLITRGDVIISINGKQTKTVNDLLDILKDKKVGDTIDMTLSRNGNLTNTTVKLEGLPS
jgi:S1-C subfamily serine protease